MKKLLFVLLLMATAANAETYKWTDSEGTVHFSDSSGKVPEKYRENAGAIKADKTPDSNNELKPDSAIPWIEPQPGTGGQAALPPQTEELKNRMMNDEGIMTLIRALQDDPEIRALLGDQAAMNAIQAGDIGKLINNPAFLKILNDPRVKEIEKKLNAGK